MPLYNVASRLSQLRDFLAANPEEEVRKAGRGSDR